MKNMKMKNNMAQGVLKGIHKNEKSPNGYMRTSQLMQLFEIALKDIYWAEKALLKAIPKMIEMSESKALVNALTNHLAETENQIHRADKIFALTDRKAQGKKCEAMHGLIKESKDITDECDEGPMRDAGIISAMQKIEHYEIASYGTLKQFAKTLEFPEAVLNLLEETLKEEKAADQKLSELAVDTINTEAAHIEA